MGCCKRDTYRILLSDDSTMVETKDVHFGEDSDRKVAKEQPKFLKFDMSDDNKIFDDLPNLHDFYEIHVHAESFDYASEERGPAARTERSTVPFESEPEDSSPDKLAFYPNIRRTSRGSTETRPLKYWLGKRKRSDED